MCVSLFPTLLIRSRIPLQEYTREGSDRELRVTRLAFLHILFCSGRKELSEETSSQVGRTESPVSYQIFWFL